MSEHREEKKRKVYRQQYLQQKSRKSGASKWIIPRASCGAVPAKQKLAFGFVPNLASADSVASQRFLLDSAQRSSKRRRRRRRHNAVHLFHESGSIIVKMECKLISRYSPLLVLFLASLVNAQTVSDILHPNYDDPSSSLKYYDIAKAMTLGCNITKEGDYELSWSKDGENVSEIDSLRDRYKIIKEERKFIISRALESDAGSYTCSVRALNASRTFNVVANVIVKFESTEIGKTNMVEGEKLSLHCVAFGTNPKITWTVGNATLSTSTDRIVLEEDDKGVENARLTIESVLLSDYTDYTCEARNNATDITGKPAQVTITVRIRGKYAALYVFLGIIAEVVVLCAIILICEKRRNKTEIEESDTDNSPDQQKNGHNGNSSELRHRKN